MYVFGHGHSMTRRILIVSHYQPLRESRMALLKSAGYFVQAASSDKEAMDALASGTFDLVLVGRRDEFALAQLDERIRAAYPKLPILQIRSREEAGGISQASRSIDSAPEGVLLALQAMLLTA